MLPLAPDYYRRNFLFLIDFVRRHRGHLIDAELADFLARFEGLPHPAQALYVRMLTRKGSLFRSDKLIYDEIGEPTPALSALTEAALVQRDPPLGIATLGALLRQSELNTLPVAQPHRRDRPNKGTLLNRLAEQTLPDQPLSLWWPEAPFTLIGQADEEPVERLQLLFFGNLHQSLSEFVVASLAHIRYPDVPLTPEAFPFQSAESVRRYQRREQRAQAWEQGELASAEWADSLGQPDAEAKLERQRQRHAFTLARQYEREGEESRALSLYQGCYFGEARERRLRLLYARQAYREALAVALSMRAQPDSEQERVVAERFLSRLSRHLWTGKPAEMAAPPQRREMSLSWEGDVESAVAEAFRASGGRAWHTENALINGVAGLLLWPVIHAPVSGAFVQPFQHRPLDLYHPDFLPRRRNRLEQELVRWRALSRPAFVRELVARYRQYQGTRCALVNWKQLPEEAFVEAVSALTPGQWLGLTRYLMADLRTRRSGQPDLLVVTSAGISLVEVKGPGDSLRDHQRRWLAELSRLSIDNCVLWVSRADA
ncbi:VRR-NUC domain-containing protein [Marinobacter hydrocarbonoclasticus]|nr:VRR-NUC domain-containing protein [Marinobacter nauticus]